MNYKQPLSETEFVEILYDEDTILNGKWKPVEGDATRILREKGSPSRIDEQTWKMIKTEAISILSNCVPPTDPPSHETGLVIGYVQSGKTLSFTTVAALARDNGYQMVIVIAGSSTNLLNQSTKRLEEDLDLNSRTDRIWKHFQNPKINQDDHVNIQNALLNWQDPNVEPWERRTVLITVMKNHLHLENLSEVLNNISLTGFPALIIDDEGDQASLNTRVQIGEESTTYQRILALRANLQHHTFLQYTATPQALLLINLIDVLSPNFAKVLTEGPGYKGGREFFQNAPNQVCIIPDYEIPTKDEPNIEIPESLLNAMRLFFLSVAAGWILDRGKGNRSMMVHPSHTTELHAQYLTWVRQIMSNWKEILQLSVDNIDYKQLLEDFEVNYQELKSTVNNLPPFHELSSKLLRVIRSTETIEINATSGSTPNVEWYNNYAHIVVGGQAMDRGFTVEGLTVTYMPRGTGSGNADTIQQRGRFFGYKEDEFGYCRVFLHNDVRDAFCNYITHEDDVRDLLKAHEESGRPLNDWKRIFFLDRSLKPTRRYVLGVDYVHGNFGNQWYTPKAPHDPIEVIEKNRTIVDNYKRRLSFKKQIPDATRIDSWHPVAKDISLQEIYEELLVPFQVKRWVDAEKFSLLQLQIAIFLDSNPNELCTVFHIRNEDSPRTRNLDDKNEIPELFQGRHVEDNSKYPGDRNVRNPSGVTIQIHEIDVIHPNGDISREVRTIAVWLPNNISADLLVQEQGVNECGD